MFEAEKHLLTSTELAQYLNVPVGWCWKAARAGQLPHVRLPGGRKFIRFDLVKVLEVLATKRQDGGANGES